MKGKYKFLLLATLIAFASCSFTSKADSRDKDKLLIELITSVLAQAHFSPQDVDDDFSSRVFDDFIEQLDPLKRYFYKSDIKEFEAYRNKIDDQLKNYDLTFFNLVYERLLKRIEESKTFYNGILDKPFDYALNETFSTDYKALKFVKNKTQMKERWRKQLKFFSIGDYDDLLKERDLDIKDSKTLAEGDFSAQNEKRTEGKENKSDEELEAEAREAIKRSLEELYDFIEDRRRLDWFSIYVNAVVEEFDPHTFYFAPEDKDRFDTQMSGNFEGIGARLSKRIDGVEVVEVISGGPAWRENELEVGDQILKVRQEDEAEATSITGMRLDDAIKLIKGPKDTTVNLTLKRVDGTIQEIAITRDIVELEETFAKSSTVIKDDNKYGVINLPKFYIDFENYNKRNASSDIKKEIERLKKEDVEGLVLDLRNNGGGSLQTVVDIVGLFIEEGPVVQVKSSNEKKEVLKDEDRSIIWDGPLVVMVNELSASASEILAAAMQDYKRAIVIGSKQTYGKGTVQNVLNLNRMMRNYSKGDLGALKFTTQKFYRINGGSTQLEGVKSDVVVPDRYSYFDIGERDQENPLPWDKIEPANYTVWQNYFDYNTTIEKSKARMAANEQLKLIDANAKWVSEMRNRENFSLNYEEYKLDLEQREEESKRFDALSDYETNLSFKSLPYEIKLMEQDTVLKEKRERWHKDLAKDVYVEEALNVLNDLKKTYTIKKLASVKE